MSKTLMQNITQRTALLSWMAIVWLVHSSCGNGQTENEGRAASAPNIVIIYADDMGYGDLAIQYPESKIKTPHLDQ